MMQSIIPGIEVKDELKFEGLPKVRSQFLNSQERILYTTQLTKIN